MSLISGGVIKLLIHNNAASMPNRTKQEDDVLRRFGVKLRAIRIMRGFTQEELAEKAGFSRSYYTEIETGKRNISLLNLYRLAEYLEVSLKDLLDIDNKDSH
jgi:DNA-binding XRE family transcriptional regulator